MDNGPIWPKQFLQKNDLICKNIFNIFFLNRLNIYATMKLHRHYTIKQKANPILNNIVQTII